MASKDSTTPITPKPKVPKEALDALLEYTPTERAEMILKHKAERAAQGTGKSEKSTGKPKSVDKMTPANQRKRFHSPSSEELSLVMSGALAAPEGVSDLPEGMRKRR
jgi:hypothetical protein